MALSKQIHPLDRYVRVDRLPHLWCPGCGIGVVMSALLRAIEKRVKEGLFREEDVVVVGGIGCTARMPLYLNFDSVHAIHGRAIPFAIGAKLANPRLKLIVVGGDGDIAGIGGNHLMHAARRNMDLTVIMVNNMVYAMTGGQLAPTTPRGLYTTTTPRGNPEKPVNVIKLVASLGANYVARASVTHPVLIERYIYKALGKEGFAFVEVLSTCPEIFGRHIGIRDAVQLFMELRKRVKIKANPSIDESYYDWSSGFVVGEYVDKDEPGYLRMIGLLR